MAREVSVHGQLGAQQEGMVERRGKQSYSLCRGQEAEYREECWQEIPLKHPRMSAAPHTQPITSLQVSQPSHVTIKLTFHALLF